ncbi:glycosyl transferase [Phytoactinopolyspora alkaliphila]|uniref:Glycosyl transferase n=1 Tax=Phytoactinopolyspora alkaliphila TaxID=1783498 RepID=A0A6N9YGJ7_9ACTN|nr:glycosyl transferase [Phytoactinopolyspora alkaliphila]NED94084.1 glycosyl transferase [Phytoactinopolyspora alkaliphila]
MRAMTYGLAKGSVSMVADYDVLMVSDLRLPGGTTASMAEEIRAHSAAGYRTALLHVNSSLTGKALGFSGHLVRLIEAGLADLVLPGDRVHARHALVRQPIVAHGMTDPQRGLTVDGVSVIANHPVRDAAQVEQYDPVAVTENMVAYFGHKPVWRPIGPVVRQQLLEYATRSQIKLADTDWRNLIDVAAWSRDRSGGVGPVPVLGRHSRPHPAKWPRKAADILAAYPDAEDFRVRILGGAEPAYKVLGRIPRRWLVEPFGARHPADFLAEIDFFVYYHHPSWVEAFGRNIIEALASGAVAILPEHFRETYGDAAVYAQPAEVRSVVARLAADPDAYAEQSTRGREYVASRHGFQMHVDRLAAEIGEPVTSWAAGTPAPSRTRVGTPPARVLFVSSNGTGMGHLTRLLAMANRTSERIEPFFFSMSSAVPVVAKFGYHWEYCPSRDDLDVTAREWNPFFAARFVDVIRRFQPKALVFDGTWPYRGFGEAKEIFPELVYIWSRRAMWVPEHRTDGLDKSAWFDLVIEPGEIAAEADRGPTVGREDARRIGPVTLLDHADLLSREQARAELGMDPDEQAMLVTLGGGNANELGPDLEAIATVMERRPGWTVYATRAPIARAAMTHADIRTISPYPLSRVMRAFDVAVVACGYNAYHETIMAGVPTIFVPKPKVTDDQFARARYAGEAGLGVSVEDVSPVAIEGALARLLAPGESERIRDRCAALYPENGAADGAALLENVLVKKGVIR